MQFAAILVMRARGQIKKFSSLIGGIGLLISRVGPSFSHMDFRSAQGQIQPFSGHSFATPHAWHSAMKKVGAFLSSPDGKQVSYVVYAFPISCLLCVTNSDTGRKKFQSLATSLANKS